jgi:hypothetical protein
VDQPGRKHRNENAANPLVADFLLAFLHIVALRSPPPSEVHGLLKRHLPEKAALAIPVAEASQCIQAIDVEASVSSLAYFDWQTTVRHRQSLVLLGPPYWLP